jgi:hypothetical protein
MINRTTMSTNKPRYILKTIVLINFLLFAGISAFSQSTSKIDFSYTLDSLKLGNEMQYKVKVTITNGEGPFMVGVFESLKTDLLPLDKKENISETEIYLTFRGKKACVIYVRNQSEGVIKTLNYN